MAAVLGGLMVMPAVFAFNLSPTAGPGLTFVTMPAIFSQMPFGVFFAILFYFCLVVAAITSSMSMLEAVVGFTFGLYPSVPSGRDLDHNGFGCVHRPFLHSELRIPVRLQDVRQERV